MKSDVDGYIAMILARTWTDEINGQHNKHKNSHTDLGPKGEVTEDRDDFINHCCTANGRSDNDVHSLLCIAVDFIEDREKLAAK